MNKITISTNIFFIGVFLFFSIICLFFITKSSVYLQHTSLFSWVIPGDFFISIPFIYLLLIKNTTIPKSSIFLVFTMCVLFCGLILPKANQYYFNLFKIWLLPFIEIISFSYLFFRVHKSLKKQKTLGLNLDFFTLTRNVCSEISSSKIAYFIATEISVFYFGFFGWKKATLKENEFSHHKKSGIVSLLFSFVFLMIMETAVLHTILIKINHTIANIFLIFGIYTTAQMLGFLKSINKVTSNFSEDKLNLKYGILAQTEINKCDIESISICNDYTKDKMTKTLSPFAKLENPNLLIYLKKENYLYGLYGFKKKYKILAFNVDDETKFLEQVGEKLKI